MFITFEGPEGSGKTTALKLVVEKLGLSDNGVVVSREPGGVRIAEDIRKIILDKGNIEMNARTEALLYAAARAQHFEEVIKPALKANKIVICDRFIDSSLAYQGVGRGLGMVGVSEINRFAINDCIPDLTIFFDIKPEDGLKRVRFDSGRELDRLDLETLDFHNKVYRGYKQLCEMYLERIVVIDATKTPDEISDEIVRVINEKSKRFNN